MVTTEQLERVLKDRETRVAQVSSPPFFQLAGPVTELCPSGTVTIVAGLPNTTLFSKVRAALEADDTEALNAAIREARKLEAPHSGNEVSADQALQLALAADTYADVRYLGRTVLSSVFLSEKLDFARVFLPYAGGPLVANDFHVSLYRKSEKARGLELLVVSHLPRLSPTEESLIRRLPAASREMQVGGGDVVLGTPAALLATVTAGLVGIGVGYAIGRALQHIMIESFNKLEEKELGGQTERLKKLNKSLSTAAIGQMIAAKRELLNELK